MSCSGRFGRNCPTGGTHVTPGEVPGRSYCPVCERPLRGDSICVAHGQVTGQPWRGFREPEVAPALLARLGGALASAAAAPAPANEHQPEKNASPPAPQRPQRGISAFCAAATTDQVEQAYPLGAGKTGALLCQYRGDGLGVEKARWALYDQQAGRYNHDGNSEVAAHALARLLSPDGVGVVPETVFSAAHDKTVQQFIPGFVAATIPERAGAEPQQAPRALPLTDETAAPATVPEMWNLYDLLRTQPDRVYEVLALDIITGNLDRHPGNIHFDRQGQLWGIDNGHATWLEFGGGEIGAWPVANSYLVLWLQGRMLPLGAGCPYAAQESGSLTFPPQLVERWRRITKAQFTAALVEADISTVGNVDLEAGWNNLQYIIAHNGHIVWQDEW